MTDHLDWEKLKDLRREFLSESPGANDYWESPELLAAYDATFAERIGWKWEAVLAEVAETESFLPDAYVLIDWGCGTGVATQRFLVEGLESHPEAVYLHDRSRLAQKFAETKVQALGANLPVLPLDQLAQDTRSKVLLISHVLNELSPEDEESLRKVILLADVVFVVEPGTSEVGKKVVELREWARDYFDIVAPCTHQGVCGMTDPANARHWCHFFAKPPEEVFHNGFWSEFSRKMSIDLRSLPVSFLILKKPTSDDEVFSEEDARVIGKARQYKGYGQVLECSKVGVVERKFLKRDNAQFLKQLAQGPFTFIYPLPPDTEEPQEY